MASIWTAAVPPIPGVRVYGSPRQLPAGPRDPRFVQHSLTSPAEQQTSDFAILFRSILPALYSCRWFFEWSFRLPNAWMEGEPGQTRFDELRLQLIPAGDSRGFEFYFCENPALIEQLVQFIQNDWDELYVFAPGQPARDQITVWMEADNYAELLGSTKAHFNNYDGCYWACYSWDPELLTTLKADLEPWQDELYVVECTLPETQRVHEGGQAKRLFEQRLQQWLRKKRRKIGPD